ncbi:MAG: transporter substrate-binding domain-containing protein [Eubacterium sp.]|jgi:ABC-type amino acid transport substrate-binding protein
MKVIRKFAVLLLSAALVLALCACGSSSSGSTDSSGSDGDSSSTDGSGSETTAKYRILDENISTEQYAIGFKKGNTELRDAVQAAVYQLLEDGTIDEVAAKYSDYNLDAMLCLDSANATEFDVDSASDDFKNRTQFVVGFDAEYPPYGYKDENGEYTGFDLELAQAVCDIYGWELVKQPIDWDAKDMELNSGAIDCIWNGFTITGREDDYTWTDPYVDNSIVVLVPYDSDIQTLDDLAGKNVVTQADSSALTALQEDRKDLADTFASLEQTADYNTAVLNMDSGMADAVAIDIGVAMYYISNAE